MYKKTAKNPVDRGFLLSPVTITIDNPEALP
jgi:hypothetical protein